MRRVITRRYSAVTRTSCERCCARPMPAAAGVQILIPPSHAWHWQTLWESGLWPRFEEMKRLLVSVNAMEAERVGREAFPVWDFSGSDGPALEPLPTTPGASMKWFWELVHFKEALGEVLLSRVTGMPIDDPALTNFGVRLDTSNIEAQMSRLRDLQQDFAADHPEAVALIQERAQLLRREGASAGAP